MAEHAISTGAALASEPAPAQSRKLELSFDLYERYSVLKQVVERLFPTVSRLHILDVGANSPCLWPGFSSLVSTFLPRARCTIADLEITPGLQRAVMASGLELPFADDAFDVVCALDTLEHIPDRYRVRFLDELVRVSRDFVYLTFPYNSVGNHWAERTVNTYLDDVLKSGIPQLNEHRDLGLPELSLLDNWTSSRNLAVSTRQHGNVDIWALMMIASHTLRIHSHDLLAELNLRFNRDYAAFDWREPGYRASYLISKLDRLGELQEIADALPPHGREQLQLSDVLALIREFSEAEIAPQSIIDKDLHIENLQKAHSEWQKALRDKERHIRNLEAALADKDAALASKGSQTASLEAELIATRRQATAIAELRLRMQKMEDSYRQLQEQHNALQAEADGLAQRLATSNHRLRESLQKMTAIVQSEIASLHTILDNHQTVLGNHQTALRNHETVHEQLKQRLTAQELFATQLVTGRTWRTLQALGRVANTVVPGKHAESQAPPAVQKPAPQPPSPVAEQPAPVPVPEPSQQSDTTGGYDVLPANELYFVCDEPSPDDKRPRNRALVVRGWALSETPLDYVEVTVDGLPPERVLINSPRLDIKRTFPDLDKNGRSGFSATVDTRALPDGQHAVRLTLIGDGQALREIETEFVIDHTVGYASDYEEWIAEFEAPADEILLLKLAHIEYKPLISILMPVFNTEPDELRAAIDSVIAQSYPYWELCIADDASTRPEIRTILSEFASRSENIKVTYLGHQSGISAALNAARRLAAGEYIALLDHDDTLSPHALAYCAEAINRHSRPDLLYSDEDKLDKRGNRFQPFFKPDWSPDLILSTNYICHLALFRKTLMDKVGDFSSDTDGSQDYDYILRASEQAQQIVHIPHVLYHWRAGPNSTASSIESKPYTVEASWRTLERFCRRSQSPATIQPGAFPGSFRFRYPIPEQNRVSIIIASGGNVDILKTNLETLFGRTEYPRFEALVIDNSSHVHVQQLVESFAARAHNVRYIDWRDHPFNYSRINNVAARQCDSPILLFLNDDISVINSEWLTSMVELVARPEVGAVGAKLLLPTGKIQHAGVVMGLFDNCGHAFAGLDGSVSHYFGFTDMIRNVSAVTGACLMTKANLFWEMGGFDEDRLAVAFSDVDLCLKLGARGYRVLFTPFAQLYHHESFSKTAKDLIPHPAEVAFMQSKWRDVIAADPYYSPNLTRRSSDYSLPSLWT